MSLTLARQDEIGQAGPAALGAWDQVVDLAGRGPLAAASEGAVPVAGDNRAAQMRRHSGGGGTDVQRQAHGGRELGGQQPRAQERGQPGWSGQNVGRVGQQQVLQPGQGPRRQVARIGRAGGAAVPHADLRGGRR